MSEFSSTFSTSSSADGVYVFVPAALSGEDEEPPTLGVREPRRPLLPALDGAVACEEPSS